MFRDGALFAVGFMEIVRPQCLKVLTLIGRRDTFKQYIVKKIQRRFITNSRKARQRDEAKHKVR